MVSFQKNWVPFPKYGNIWKRSRYIYPKWINVRVLTGLCCVMDGLTDETGYSRMRLKIDKNEIDNSINFLKLADETMFSVFSLGVGGKSGLERSPAQNSYHSYLSLRDTF